MFQRCFSSSPRADLRHITADILKTIPRERTRNLSIIAHVDHGKSTLSDRLMELTHTISSGGRAQYLDKLQVERERGITIKAQTVSMLAEQENSEGNLELYLINLIDTPGHVDFSYEVCRGGAALGRASGNVLAAGISQLARVSRCCSCRRCEPRCAGPNGGQLSCCDIFRSVCVACRQQN